MAKVRKMKKGFQHIDRTGEPVGKPQKTKKAARALSSRMSSKKK